MVTDVLVIGAGVIGLTTAIQAAEAGMRVRLVAADPPPGTRPRRWPGRWSARCSPHPATGRELGGKRPWMS